jgi:uncharacterized protein
MSMLNLDTAIAVGLRHFALDPANTQHGPKHWSAVLHNALDLGAREGLLRSGEVLKRGAPSEFLVWFAVLHDCCRTSEDADPKHGERAAELVDGLVRDGTIRLHPFARPADLAYAIARHSTGRTSANKLIGLCWDADRLDLPRVGITPFKEFMSTVSGCELATPRPMSRRGVMR